MTTAHLASIPDRVDSLRLVLASLTGQIDHIYVALNGYHEIPSFDFPNVTYKLMDNTLGDAAKFAFVNEVDGLALITDDDIVWTPQGIDILKQKVAQYNCPVSLHGKKYDKDNFRGFKYFTGNYRCLNTVDGDHPIDVIGTGTLMYHTSMVRLSLADFPVKNMADIWFSKLCKEQGVDMMVAGHKLGVVKYTYPKTTIWQTNKDHALHSKVIKNFL